MVTNGRLRVPLSYIYTETRVAHEPRSFIVYDIESVSCQAISMQISFVTFVYRAI